MTDLPVLLLTETLTRHRIRRAVEFAKAFAGSLTIAALIFALLVVTP